MVWDAEAGTMNAFAQQWEGIRQPTMEPGGKNTYLCSDTVFKKFYRLKMPSLGKQYVLAPQKK